MPEEINLGTWDDQTVLLTLQHVTQRVMTDADEGSQQRVETEDEARQALAAFVRQYADDEKSTVSPLIVPSDANVASRGRRVLEQLANDPVIGPKIGDLIVEPPRDAQMAGVAEMAQSAIVLAAILSWLQTKVDLSISRKSGRIEWSFQLRKGSAQSSLMADIANQLVRLVR